MKHSVKTVLVLKTEKLRFLQFFEFYGLLSIISNIFQDN